LPGVPTKAILSNIAFPYVA